MCHRRLCKPSLQGTQSLETKRRRPKGSQKRMSRNSNFNTLTRYSIQDRHYAQLLGRIVTRAREPATVAMSSSANRVSLCRCAFSSPFTQGLQKGFRPALHAWGRLSDPPYGCTRVPQQARKETMMLPRKFGFTRVPWESRA